MTKYKFLILAFLPFCLFADCADCEAYKTQVVNDCDSLLSLINSCQSEISSVCITANNGATMTSGSSQGQDQQSNIYFTSIYSAASSTASSLSSLGSFVSSIRSTAQSLQCNAFSNTVGSCDCAQYLQTLIGLVQTVNQSVSGIATGLDSIKTTLGEYNEGDDLMPIVGAVNDIMNYSIDTFAILERFFEYTLQDGVPFTISDFYDVLSSLGRSLTNSVLSVQSTSLPLNYVYRKMSSTLSNQNFNLSSLTYFQNSSQGRRLSINEQIWYGNVSLLAALGSLNNYAYTNMLAISTIARKMDNLTNTVDISSITNLLEEKFTIFNPSSPLEIYTQGSEQNYYQFLTNYYIKVSTGGTLSPSEPHTNWFSRIEMLLASLVFKDEGTNFVDNAENTSELENTLSQSVDTLSQAVSVPQNVTGKIDNMGQSFLGLLGEWRSIVSGNSLPSQFVLCDINLSSQNRDSAADSSVSSFRLETSLDSGEFRQFLDFCHAITTILFTMLFVWLSIMLLSFLLTSLAKLAQFCYLVYSALFGG